MNDIVRALLQSGQPGEVFPWKHSGMCRDCATLFNRDRIDLNVKGARRYANSLREAAYVFRRSTRMIAHPTKKTNGSFQSQPHCLKELLLLFAFCEYNIERYLQIVPT